AVAPAEAPGSADPGVVQFCTLAELASRISSAADIDAALAATVKAARQVTGAPFVSFWLADEAERTLTLRAWSDDTGGPPYPRRTAPYGQVVVGWVAKHRQPPRLPGIGGGPWGSDRGGHK